MHTILRALVALSVLVSSACVAQPPYDVTYRVETPIGQCSGTAISRKAIVFVDHCIQGADLRAVTLDGELVDVVKVLYDGNNAILIVDRKFTRWVQIAPKPKPGDAVHMIGNPYDLKDLRREGYFAGQQDVPFQAWDGSIRGNGTLLFDIEGGHGDSGAGIFDRFGRLIAPLEGGYTPTESFRMIRALPLAFTKAQWAEARK